MKMKKRLITIVMVLAMVSISLTAIASDYVSVTLNGRTFTISYDEIRRLAEINNVDPVELKEAYEMGVDEDGRFSPFSRVKTLDNGVTKEELEELNKLKMSSTGVPLTRPSTDSASDYVSITLNGKTFTISYDEIRRLAEINNVDPVELKEAYEMGVDEDGRFSPFSRVKTLDNGVTKEELEELNKLKMSSTGVPLTRPSTDSEDFEGSMIQKSSWITRRNQDTTAYNWTGNKTANGNWPKLGIVACHRKKDIYGGSSNQPVIPFGKQVIMDRDIWLPDGVDYQKNFIVDDTGRGPGKTNYWLDIYYHNDIASAQAYGNRVLNYEQER